MTLETGMKFCHDFMVVIDTNCFENYSNDRSIVSYRSCDKCHTFFVNKQNRQGLSPGCYFITDSIFGEIIQQRQEYLENVKEQIRKVNKMISSNISLPSDIDLAKDLKEYLDKFNIQILPHPDNKILPRIIDRALNKKLPFKQVDKNQKASDKGFKDVLLWETLLEYDYESKRIGKLFLLTANEKDFPILELSQEWNNFHPQVELDIVKDWDEFQLKERLIFPELVAQNNVPYARVLEVFQDDNPDIIELPNYKKKLTGRKDSTIVEIETDVKEKNGKIYQSKYYYDIKINDVTLNDPEEILEDVDDNME